MELNRRQSLAMLGLYSDTVSYVLLLDAPEKTCGYVKAIVVYYKLHCDNGRVKLRIPELQDLPRNEAPILTHVAVIQ